MLYKKFKRLTFPKNEHTLNTKIYFCDSRILVRIDIIGFRTRDRFGKESVLQPLVRIDLFEA